MAYKLLGKDFTPPDLRGKVTGKARYAEDFRAEGMVFCKLLLSPMPHARVTSIDTSDALAMEGVVGVLTAEDVPASRSSRLPRSMKRPQRMRSNSFASSTNHYHSLSIRWRACIRVDRMRVKAATSLMPGSICKRSSGPRATLPRSRKASYRRPASPRRSGLTAISTPPSRIPPWFTTKHLLRPAIRTTVWNRAARCRTGRMASASFMDRHRARVSPFLALPGSSASNRKTSSTSLNIAVAVLVRRVLPMR